MFCHPLTFCEHLQEYEYPYQRDVESHFMAAIYMLFTGPMVWFHYLEALILCH